MKKLKSLIILCLLLITLIANAQQQVSKQEATIAAINTLYNKAEVLNRSFDTEIDTVHSFSNTRSNVLMYEVVFKNSATVLLSGSKASLPVLGYYIKPAHDNGTIFDTTNTNVSCCLRSFLYDYIQEIEWCFAQNNNVRLSYQSQWDELQQSNLSRANPPTNIIVDTLLTTKWGQSHPNNIYVGCNTYNYYVEDTNSSCDCALKRCPVGCTAVAMGQIMKYWNYPVYLPNQSYQYDWCNMPDGLYTYLPPDYYENTNYETERNAVARLLKDCADKADMEYCQKGTCGSGASESNARKALVNDFGYNSDADHQQRIWWSDAVWKGRIKNNLNQGWPVFYSGYGSGGHAFVCDGYDSDEYFHFNWGWTGSYDGWFTIDDIIFVDANDEINNYTKKQHAIFYIHPNDNTDYCNYTFSLDTHFAAGGTHQNVPKTFMKLKSASETSPAAWRTITPGHTAEYVAHEVIYLNPGFSTESGAIFTARIESCVGCLQGSKSMVFTNTDENESEVKNFNDNELFYAENHLQTNNFYKDFKLYPNPNKGNFQLETNFLLSDITNLKVMDMLGVTVYETKNITSNTISLENSAAGFYCVVIILKDGTVLTQKMMVQR